VCITGSKEDAAFCSVDFFDVAAGTVLRSSGDRGGEVTGHEESGMDCELLFRKLGRALLDTAGDPMPEREVLGFGSWDFFKVLEGRLGFLKLSFFLILGIRVPGFAFEPKDGSSSKLAEDSAGDDLRFSETPFDIVGLGGREMPICRTAESMQSSFDLL
jgi:hypothetical protein